MKTFALVSTLALAIVHSSADRSAEFSNYVKKYNLAFSDESKKSDAFNTFSNNMAAIEVKAKCL
jgi:hypothetical protein